MKKLLLFSLIACGALGSARAQQLVSQAELVLESRPAKPVICYARHEDMNTYVAPPAQFLNRTAGRPTADRARIEVTYIGFPADARAAFQKAVDIWQSLLFSPVVIRVEARWEALDEGVLGAAGATQIYRNLPGAPKSNIWYPVALAEKIVGQELNGTNADISAEFSSNFDWYLGLDGLAPAGKFDLVSVVLHELGHGLGFVAASSYTDPPPVTGPVASLNSSGFPWIFSTYIENGPGQRLAGNSRFPSPSLALADQFTSNDLYFGSPLVNAVTNGLRARLYAPAKFDGGSSISHLDEASYRAGDPNSLMTPQIGRAEAIQNPGPITLKMFDEMGWFNTAIRHNPSLRDTETAQDFVVRANVVSDGTIVPGSVRLYYRVDNGTDVPDATDTVLPMTAASGSTQYTATIPNPGLGRRVSYYISAADVETARTYTAPGVLLSTEATNTQPRYQFFVGPDVVPPVLVHQPASFIFASNLPLVLTAQANDNIGVASVSVAYSVNGISRPTFNLTRQADNITYRGSIASTASAPIVAGDIIAYRLIARDASSNANQTVSPASDVYRVPVVSIKAPQASYVNNFNAITAATPPDFVGNGFSIAQPEGFSDLAIHSAHPYPDADNTLIYQLLTPIIVEADPAKSTLTFDEVVLVEPGSDGAPFPSADFFDYVVVEGSKDGGQTWNPVADGYDSRDKEEWLAAYNSAINSDQNSTAVGTQALFLPRAMNLRDNGYFLAGDVVRLRFRLFADPAAHGWGWAIDNLRIQDNTVTSLASELKKTGGLNVYPNPSEGRFTVQARFAKPTIGLQIIVRNNLGQVVLRQSLAGAQTELKQALNLSALSAGMYMVSVGVEGDAAVRKVLIAK
ncbi:T9SS type A sorting domain-containing protein [Hymenobacter sp. BT188]|uniref:T9SS type A sorting domain-containing protein n=1 Tax=Hymenobacter sp. BT188 TaxID=2763504 RepID=UPI0016514DDB|nr:T9SS type A sorting domain-containing protein [Hymenobacter sp. BT188]MBC6606170.1 T9SS type A sorting domain-containing protein [Hymenobacter sp. BT188]